MTDLERTNKVTAIWSDVTDHVAKEMFLAMHKRKDERKELNPILVMADSGARGSDAQIRQLAGMRGLMAKPSGEIIENPILANFREGLDVLQYFISTHGARKGLADTALKTADSGYLTRRLVDVAQDVIVSGTDCGTLQGVWAESDHPKRRRGREFTRPHRRHYVARRHRRSCRWDGDRRGEHRDQRRPWLAGTAFRSAKVRIRSALTCESRRGVCVKCYGRNLATGNTVEIGEAVGVIAAQSIGEPGTQLTMRTFHVGGTARLEQETKHVAAMDGTVKYLGGDMKVIKNRAGEYDLASPASRRLALVDDRGREVAHYKIVYGAQIHVKDKQRSRRTTCS